MIERLWLIWFDFISERVLFMSVSVHGFNWSHGHLKKNCTRMILETIKGFFWFRYTWVAFYNYAISLLNLVKIGWITKKDINKNIPGSSAKSASSNPEKSRGMATLLLNRWKFSNQISMCAENVILNFAYMYYSRFAKDHLFVSFWHCIFQSYYHHIKIIFLLKIHLYEDLINVYLSYRFVMYTLHDKHVEKHTHGNLVFYGHVLSLKRVQAARLLPFYCKTVFEISKLWQIDRLDVVLVKMRWTLVLEWWRLAVHKGTLPMSLGVSKSVVVRMWNRFQTTGNVLRGHTFNDSSQEPIYWVHKLLETGCMMLGWGHGDQAIRIPLTQRHIQDLLQWAQIHVTWTVNDWTPVLFTDESRFCVDFTDRRARVCTLSSSMRCKRDENTTVLVGVSIMVWAGISARGKTDLHIIENGTLTVVRYVNEILDVHVRTYVGAVSPNFILMDNKACAHRAHITNRYLEEATIVRMDWPARSPDLNPIEHAWDMLQKAISSRHVQPITVQELLALIQEWVQIPHRFKGLLVHKQHAAAIPGCN